MSQAHSLSLLVPLAFGALLLGASAGGCGEDFQSNGGNGSSSSSGGGSGGATTTSSGAGGSTSSSSGTGGAADACKDLGEACSQCEFQACPDIYCNCYDNEACKIVIYCLSGCAPGLNDCSQECYTLHAAGIADAALAQHCAATNCSNDCFAGLQALPPCDYCIFESCESQVNACLADPTCAQLLYCAQACDNPTCVSDCEASFSGGAALAEPLRQCMNDHCSADCAWAG